jgi:hypothetical protein
LRTNSANLSYNADTNTLTCANFAGNATSATTSTTSTTATNANNIDITNTTTGTTFFPTFVSANTGSLNLRTNSANLSYNADTNTLTCANFAGNATTSILSVSSITATNANNILLTSDNSSGTYYIPFSKFPGSTTARSLFVDDTTTPLSYNPNTSTLTTTNFSGTATNSSNILITSDNTNGTYYLPFTKTTGTGNKALFIDDTTTPLTYNPSTGLLQTYGLQVVNKNILSNCLFITSNYTLTTSSPEYIFIDSSSGGYTVTLPSVTSANIGLKFSIHCNTPFVSSIIGSGSYIIFGSVAYNTSFTINMSKFNTGFGGVTCANFVEIVYFGSGAEYSNVWAITGGSSDVYADSPNIFTGGSNIFKTDMILQDRDDVGSETPTTVTINTTTTNFENSILSPFESSVNFKNKYTDFISDNLTISCPSTLFSDRFIVAVPPVITPVVVTYENSEVNFNSPTINYNNPSGGDQTITFDNTHTIFNKTIKLKNQYQYSAYDTIINSNTTISTPYYQYYSFNTPTGNIDITLPTPIQDLLGLTITFNRSDTTSPNYHLYSDDYNIWEAGTPSNTICYNNTNSCTISVLKYGGGYRWFRINQL